MATFKQIRGQTIKKYTTNPTNPLEGQIWYNNTTGTLKVYTMGVAAWASGTAYPGGMTALRGAGATNTAAIAIGGESPGPTVDTTNTYDGNAWTGAPVIPGPARNVFAMGTTAAALYAGGNTLPGQNPITNASAEYNGSTWTGGPTMPVSRGFGASSGIQTSALTTGGDNGVGGSNDVSSYNGSTWATETVYPTTAYGVTGCGATESTAFVAGGSAPFPGDNVGVATYDGSAWTLTATPVTTIIPGQGQQLASSGPSTEALAFGGIGGQNKTASWNGTAWATQPNLATGRDGGGAGTAASALCFGGSSPGTPRETSVEEFTGAALEVQTVTTS